MSITFEQAKQHQGEFREHLKDVATPEECQQVQNRHGLGYLAWHAAVKLWAKDGQRQKWCLTCARYRFPYEQCPVFNGGRRS